MDGGWAVNWTAARFFLDLVILAGLIAIGIYTWWTNRNRATEESIKTVQSESDQKVEAVRSDHRLLESRVASVEQEIRHSPTKRDIEALTSRIGELHGDMREVSGTMKGLQRAVDLMNEHLLSQGSKN